MYDESPVLHEKCGDFFILVGSKGDRENTLFTKICSVAKNGVYGPLPSYRRKCFC